MKKLFGFKIGGLMHKIFNLVLIFILAIIGVFGCVSAYQAKELSTVIDDANRDQQQAIEKVSGDTMHKVIESSMVKTNALQAYISDDMFAEVKGDIELLQASFLSIRISSLFSPLTTLSSKKTVLLPFRCSTVKALTLLIQISSEL